MPEHDDSAIQAKKHRVIHWNPDEDIGSEGSNASKTKFIATAAIILAVVATVGAVGIYGINAFKDSNSDVQSIASSIGLDDSSPQGQQNVQEAFVSRSKAEFSFESVTRMLDNARQMPTEHTALTQKLIAIEKEYLGTENLMKRSSYNQALTQIGRLSGQINEFTTEVENKQASQEMYDNFLLNVEELEKNKHLNEIAYEASFAAASAGKQFLDEGSFTAARTKLEEASENLNALDVSIQEYIQSNAAMGHRYILQGESDKAIEAFTNIMKMDPDNEDAILHLERAKVADQVYSLIVLATSNEESEKFEEALEYYEEAFQIDRNSAKAQQGASRMRRSIEDRDFSFHYSAATAALEIEEFDKAIEHFKSAMEIFPTRTDLQQAINKAKLDKRQMDIVTMITKAYDFEKGFKWESARKIYHKLIEMEPELQQAKDGLLRTGKMIRSLLRFEKLIEVATLEAQQADFQTAISTFDKAMQSKPNYLDLNEEAERLRRYLQQQSRPVEVQFFSDANTWVTVQGPSRYKPLKFKESIKNLLPGKYLIIGRKKGYEDIRYPIQIRAGIEVGTQTVICDTKRNF